MRVKLAATESDGCGRCARLRDSPDRKGMRRLEEKEGMSILRFDQWDRIPSIRQQGERAGVRGTERTMFKVDWILRGRIGNRTLVNADLDEFRPADAANLGPGFARRHRQSMGNRRRQRSEQHRTTCDPGSEAASDSSNSHPEIISAGAPLRKWQALAQLEQEQHPAEIHDEDHQRIDAEAADRPVVALDQSDQVDGCHQYTQQRGQQRETANLV